MTSFICSFLYFLKALTWAISPDTLKFWNAAGKKFLEMSGIIIVYEQRLNQRAKRLTIVQKKSFSFNYLGTFIRSHMFRKIIFIRANFFIIQ